jgi:hypothetical protein
LVQNALFPIPKIIWISLIQNSILIFFLVIPSLARLIEYIITEHFCLEKSMCVAFEETQNEKKY